MINMQEYLSLSEKTTSDSSKNGKRTLFPNDADLLHQMMDVIQIADAMDAVKRSIFYYEKKEDSQVRLTKATARLIKMYEKLEEPETKAELKIKDEDLNLLHACLGIQSEVGEIVEELINSHLEERPLDTTNLQEEVGDQLWYLALALRSINSTFEIVASKNINKLKARYPDNFKPEDALNRDLEAEKVALESDKPIASEA